MKTYFHIPLSKVAAILMILLLTSCSGYFDNPIKNKTTGKDITLLLLDTNFFTTRVTYKFIDAKDGSLITSPATITFTGKNANDIVTFGGNKNSDYTTSVGELELTVDPNVTFNENNPFEFAVNVDADGYEPMSKGVQFQSTGKKTVELYLSKVSDQDQSDLNGTIDTSGGDTTFVFIAPWNNGLKSATATGAPYEIHYSITLNSILKFEDFYGNLLFSSSQEAMDAYYADPDNFIHISISSFSGYDPWIDVLNIDGTSQSVIFHLLETGTLTGIQVAGTWVGFMNGGVVSSTAAYTGTPVPDYFGFAQFSGSSYTITGTSAVYADLGSRYKLISASDEILCPTGTSLIFRSSVISSFSITADVYDREDPPQLINVINFTGEFPDTFAVENTPPIPVTLKFRTNNPAFKPIPDLQIDNFCVGSATVTVEPETGYLGYQIVLKAYCPDDPTIAVAPTYSGEYRIANTDDQWQGTSMVGGVVNLLGLPDQEYEYRLLWKNEWEYTNFWTEFDAAGNYIHETDARSIISETLPDGRIRISIDQDFKQSICDDLGW